MKNNSLIEYKEKFIIKLKKFFSKLFNRKQEIVDEYIKSTTDEEIIDNKSLGKRTFKDEIIVDNTNINKTIEKNKFLAEIDGNLEKLNQLSVEKLEQIEKYYDSAILKNDAQIKQLKAST